jgi:DNA primase|tara:strand:+ start:527 stop:2335 length:1809 start_codon:yes stop_codon:yes gene_type:complete
MARFSKDFISEIKGRLKVSDVVRRSVKLTQRGAEFVGLSPFKNEKTPSFTVNDQKEFYHCFSTSEHGDIFSFIMKTKGLTYPEAIEMLAIQAGLDPEKGKIKDNNYNEQINLNLFKLIDEAKNFYIENLKTSNIPKLYLDKRDVNKEIISKFEIGYANNQNNDLFNFLKSKGYEVADILKLGLIKKSKYKENEYYDFFRNRLIFPIKDYRSRVIAFGGRELDNSEIKYINSSDSIIFKKSFNLYNISLAIEEKRNLDELYLVEGYMDAVSLYQNGFKTVVAPLGTAVTKFQLEAMWRYCKCPTIIFDGDEAGQKAALRAARLSLPLLKPEYSLKVCILPNNTDPDDYLKQNSDSDFKRLLNKSQSLSDFIWNSEYGNSDISTPEQKAGFEKKIISITNEIADKTIADYYKKYFNDKIIQLKRSNNVNIISKQYKNFSKPSREALKSERANLTQPESIIREKIMLWMMIENSRLVDKYIEEIGNIQFNDKNLAKICSKILDFCSQDNKNLENKDLKTYLEASEFSKLIRSVYNPSLLETYKFLINKQQVEQEKSFEELLKIHSVSLSNETLDQAVLDLEKNMDQESFENFVKAKMESLNKDNK